MDALENASKYISRNQRFYIETSHSKSIDWFLYEGNTGI